MEGPEEDEKKRKRKKKEENSDFLHMGSSGLTPKDFEDLYSATGDMDFKGFPKHPEPKKRSPEPQRQPVEVPGQEKKFTLEKDDISIGPLNGFEAYNDLIISQLDRHPLIHNLFGVPEVQIEKTAAKSYSITREKIPGELYAVAIKKAQEAGEGKEQLDKRFNVQSAQKYALLQLWIKAEEGHGASTLIQKNPLEELVPISFNHIHCISHDPTDATMLPRTTRWEKWPQLELPVDPQVKEFVLRADPSQIVNDLKTAFLIEYKSELTEEQFEWMELKFHHLLANMVTLFDAVNADMNFRQILALILPEINQHSFNFVTQGQMEGGELWPARERYAKLPTAFLSSWGKALHWRRFRIENFRSHMQKEIEKIGRLPKKVLDQRYFNEICFELRRGMYL